MYGRLQVGRNSVIQRSWELCPWLVDSLTGMIRVLEHGGTLSEIQRTPYEKVIDPDGVTTEFVRCPDPTASESS